MNNKSPEKPKNNFFRWLLIIGFLLFIEGALLLAYGSIMTLYKLSEDTAFIYILLVFLIPVITFAFKLHHKSLNKIGLACLAAFIVCAASIGVTTTLPEQTQSTETQRSFTGEDLLTEFNKQRDIFNARPVKTNQYVCKMAELHLNDVLTHGPEVITNEEALVDVYDKVKESSYNGQLTKENHVPDNIMSLVTDKKNAEETMKIWTESVETSYAFSDSNFEFGCAVVKDGYGVLIMGYDDESMEPLQEDKWSTISTWLKNIKLL